MTENQPGGMTPPPYGQPSSQYQAPAYQAPMYQGAGGRRASGGGSGRPGGVSAAAVLTYLGAAVVLAVGLLMLLALVSTAVAREAVSSGDFGDMTLGGIRIMFGCVGAGCLVFGVALIMLAVNAARGRGGPRIALTVIGGLFVVAFSFSVVNSPEVLVPVLYVALAVLLLWVGGANGYFRQQKAARKAETAASSPGAPPTGPQAPPFP